MVRLTLPSGEIMEIHDDLIERAFGIFAAEREELLEAIGALLKDDNPESRAHARALLNHYRRK